MANIPIDGRLTSFNLFTGPFDGTELFYIVAPGNVATGKSFAVTSGTLAGFFAAFPSLNRTVVTGGSTYNAVVTDTQILVDKAIGSPTSIIMPAAGSMTFPFPVLIKDWKGDANANPITITFSGGQTCDGLSSIEIQNAFGWVYIEPGPLTGSGATGWGFVG